jgi:hypothetical protein
MTYKTVNFNIFRENLQDIVFGKDSEFHPKNQTAQKTAEFKISKEITLKPLNTIRREGKIFNR